MRHIISILVPIWLIFPCFGQQNNQENKIEVTGYPVEVHDSLYYEGFKLNRQSDLTAAKYYALKSWNLSKKYNHPSIEAKASKALAYLYDQADQIDSAKYYYHHGIRTARINHLDERLMYLYNDMGNLCERMDLYDSALKYYNEAFDIATKINSPYDQAIASNNIGLVFYHLDNYTEALSYLENAIRIKKEKNIKEGISLNLLNVAIIYNDQSRFEDALLVLQDVKKNCGDCSEKTLADMEYGFGYSLFKSDRLAEAYPYFMKAMQLSKASNHKLAMANSLFHISFYHVQKGDIATAIDLLEESESIAKSIHLRRLQRDIYLRLSELYRGRGDLAKVDEYQRLYITMKDSIFNEQLANNLRNIQLDAQRKQSEEILSQKDAQLDRNIMVNRLLSVVAFLLVILVVLVYRQFNTNRRMKTKLEKEVQRRTAELERSNRELTEANFEYDHLIYRISHDIRGPIATFLGLAHLTNKDLASPEIVRDYLDRMNSVATKLNSVITRIGKINTIKHQPVFLEKIDINVLLQEVRESMKHFVHFPLVSFSVTSSLQGAELCSDRELLTYILKSMLENCYQYSNPKELSKYIKINISKSHTGEDVFIHVEDNGIGVDKETSEKVFGLFFVGTEQHGAGLGLFLSQLCAKRIGGRIKLISNRNPTTFQLRISNKLQDAQAKPLSDQDRSNRMGGGEQSPLVATSA
jgi:signal transduction histidine kinase